MSRLCIRLLRRIKGFISRNLFYCVDEQRSLQYSCQDFTVDSPRERCNFHLHPSSGTAYAVKQGMNSQIRQKPKSIGPNLFSSTPIEKLFERPLILGASVSADWLAQSPGKKLALRYTELHQIKTIAFGGSPGLQVLKHLSEEDLSDRTIVIGVDLFFWDSTFPSPEASMKALKKLVDQTAELDIPLVLGEIPELIPERQPGLKSLNHALSKVSHAYPHCHLMLFNQLLHQILEEGHLHIKGRDYSIPDLVPDGLHLGEIAGEFLADRLLSAIAPSALPS